MYLRTRDPSNLIPLDSPHWMNLDNRLSKLLMRLRESGIIAGSNNTMLKSNLRPHCLGEKGLSPR